MRVKKFSNFLNEGMDSKAYKILIIVAMDAEAQPTIKKLGLQQQAKIGKFPFEIYTGLNKSGGASGNSEVTLVVSGKDSKHGVDNVGTQVASAMATAAISKFDPDVVINIGTAGGFKSAGSQIGSLYIGSRIQFHDRRINIPGFDAYGEGDYDVTVPEGVKSLFPGATVSTGNSLDITDAERTKLSELAKKGPVVKEMEAAAIAQVCSWNEKPLIVLKSVTDLIDGGEVPHEEFMRNLGIASEKLQAGLLSILQKL